MSEEGYTRARVESTHPLHCDRCGAVVADIEVHDRWHKKQDHGCMCQVVLR